MTEIAPMYIIGPQTHGRIGKTVWPCASHWRESIENSSDDEFIVSTGIEFEASQFEKKVSNKRLSRSRKGSPRARRRLLEPGSKLNIEVAEKGDVADGIKDPGMHGDVQGELDCEDIGMQGDKKVSVRQDGKTDSVRQDGMKDSVRQDVFQDSPEFIGRSDEDM